MGTSENIQAWSKTASTNASADSSINWAEGMDPGAVNNSGRSMMAAGKKYAEDRDGGLAAGGTGNAITLTTNQVLSAGHIAAGLTLSFRATATNTGATTLNVDSTGAVSVVDQFGAALAAGAITSGGVYTVAYNANTSKWVLQTPAVVPVAALPTSGTGAPGMVLLTSGTVSSAATLDLVLTSYSGYRAFSIILTNFVPATDGVTMLMRFSTDGGSSYDAGASDYGYVNLYWTDTISSGNAGAVGGRGTAISLTEPTAVGNGAAEGVDFQCVIFDHDNTSRWTRVSFSSEFVDSNGSVGFKHYNGAGIRRTAQNTDAVRVLFSSGNIATGSYALYGLR